MANGTALLCLLLPLGAVGWGCGADAGLPDIVVFPDISAATTYEQAAAILTPAGFQPVLTFGDAQGAIQSVSIDGQPPQVGQTYRRNTVVEFTAL